MGIGIVSEMGGNDVELDFSDCHTTLKDILKAIKLYYLNYMS